MYFHKWAVPLTSLLLISPGMSGPVATTTPCRQGIDSAAWHDTIIKNWLTLWGGDYSLLNKTVAPGIQLYQDRFPTGNGSVSLQIDNSAEFLAFVKTSRTSFEKYGFKDDLHFGVNNLITLRWTLDAVYAGAAGTTLKAGSHVAYNGTDILMLDKCTGLVNEVLSAQDFITYFHILGEPIGVV